MTTVVLSISLVIFASGFQRLEPVGVFLQGFCAGSCIPRFSDGDEGPGRKGPEKWKSGLFFLNERISVTVGPTFTRVPDSSLE